MNIGILQRCGWYSIPKCTRYQCSELFYAVPVRSACSASRPRAESPDLGASKLRSVTARSLTAGLRQVRINCRPLSGMTPEPTHCMHKCFASGFAESAVKHDHDAVLPPEIDFTKSEVVFKQKSSLELARSFIVLHMCSYNIFVNNSLKLMNLGLRVLGQALFTALMTASFYGQFAASPHTVEQVARRLDAATIAPMLATTTEEEVEDDPDRIDEDKYDRNLYATLQCLDRQAKVARKNQPILSQLKITSCIKANVLAKLSDAMRVLNYNFLTDSPISVANFLKGLDGNMEKILELTEEEMVHLLKSLDRLNTIIQKAINHDIHILVDAEFVATNPAMSLVTFAMMKKYNSTRPNVWNTYQCYLKSAMKNLKRGLAVADAEGFQFGVKVVRGAYMDHTRAEARAAGRTDPINPTYDATNKMYDQVVAYLMDLVHERGSQRINFIIATHNTDSVQKAVRRMWELQLPPKEGGVVFGQLMGMCDHVSYGLGQAGYLTYKSIPFGILEDVMPNLSRRVVENKTVFHRLQQEKLMLRREITRRALPWR